LPDDIIVEFDKVSKRFPGAVALKSVSLKIKRGSVHGLVGENGAGKSTLGKALAGIHVVDEGRILVDTKPVHLGNPRDALQVGIGMVHQELAFCENLTVAENLCLGQMPTQGLFISREEMTRRAVALLDVIGSKIDVGRRLGELSIGQQQMVQIAASVARGARIMIFDEPTSSLSQMESEKLFGLIRKLQKDGVTSIYVSHRMPEIMDLCDTISVLRDGQLVDTLPTSELDEDEIVRLMIGRKYESHTPECLNKDQGNELLRVENLHSSGKFSDISFTVKAGEILGMAGLVGSGRTEVAEAIFGLDPACTGNVFVAGDKAPVLGNPVAAINAGLGLIPEDRKRHGLVLSMTAKENITLPILRRLAYLGLVRKSAEIAIALNYFKAMRIKASGVDATSASLSGGNQQKLVIARWLAAQCKVLLVDEPTRGVDVGAKSEIHALLDELACDGSAILLVSSELPEVLKLSTRILVLRGGKIAGELQRKDFSQEAVMRLMAGMEEEKQ